MMQRKWLIFFFKTSFLTNEKDFQTRSGYVHDNRWSTTCSSGEHGFMMRLMNFTQLEQSHKFQIGSLCWKKKPVINWCGSSSAESCGLRRVSGLTPGSSGWVYYHHLLLGSCPTMVCPRGTSILSKSNRWKWRVLYLVISDSSHWPPCKVLQVSWGPISH